MLQNPGPAFIEISSQDPEVEHFESNGAMPNQNGFTRKYVELALVILLGLCESSVRFISDRLFKAEARMRVFAESFFNSFVGYAVSVYALLVTASIRKLLKYCWAVF